MKIARYDENDEMVVEEITDPNLLWTGGLNGPYPDADRIVAWGPCSEAELVAATAWATQVYEEATYGIDLTGAELESYGDSFPTVGFPDVWESVTEIAEEDGLEALEDLLVDGRVVESFSDALAWQEDNQ